MGLIFIVAITGFTTLAILLGGWSSRNKYSLVGALRGAAQMISYEIPMILALLVVAMVVGSLRLDDVVAAQAGYQWIAFYAPFTFFIFYIASIAELNRGPFDLPESESELVAGYGTEYSGMRFGMFFLNEYAGLTIMSMVTVTLFFGGWHGPFEDAIRFWGVSWLPLVWFLVKTYVLVFMLVWIRLSLPRLQVDQLMAFAWKILIPLGLLNILATGARHALGAAVEVRHGRLQLARASWRSSACFDPDPQVAAAPAACAPAGGERLMLGMLKAMRTTCATCR